MSKTMSYGLLCRLAVAGAVLSGLAGLAGVAHASQVGVAAAVNPDAFSSLNGAPQSQLNIGKSIFYNERINTTGSGLVQVLLVDGSTFTVGPGSDLVIDKFVYNPRKGSGEITASFTKGVMRFVGGKISKSDNAVSINTPAGALAIRGCIVMGQVKSPSNYGFLLVYGEYMKMKGQTVFQPGNGFFATDGKVTMGPPPKNFFSGLMAGLTNGNSSTGNPNPGSADGGTKPGTQYTKFETLSLQDLIADATTDEINNTLATEEKEDTATPIETPPPPTDTTPPPTDTTGDPTPNPGDGDGGCTVNCGVETVELPAELSTRVLTAPEIYVANTNYWGYGTVIGDPGKSGIVGGNDIPIPCYGQTVCGDGQHFFQVQTDDFDVTSDSIANGRLKGSVQPLIEFQRFDPETHRPIFDFAPAGGYDFPIFDTAGVHEVTDASVWDVDAEGNVINRQTLVGSAFTGKDGGFFAYQLFPKNTDGEIDFNQPLLMFGGDRFIKPANEPDQLRTFAVYTDPRQGIAVPFAAAVTAPRDLDNVYVSPLFVLENSPPPPSLSHDNNHQTPNVGVWVQTSYLAVGNGPDQQSILVLALGEQQADGQLVGARRGTSHAEIFVDDDNNPETPAVSRGIQTINLAGAIASLAGPDAGADEELAPNFDGQNHSTYRDRCRFDWHRSQHLCRLAPPSPSLLPKWR